MWYDEASMVFLYQDSQEPVVGARANCVGWQIGSTTEAAEIRPLTQFFGPDFRFRFPFRQAFGTDDVTNLRTLTFWKPPQRDGHAMPVKWWRDTSRSRVHWIFPVGTIFGEVLFEQGPDGQSYAFEVRVRRRYREGWDANLFRPFLSADALADAIVERRPEWRQSPKLKAAVEHLRNTSNLKPHAFTSIPYERVFPGIDGALDQIPDFDDPTLVAELLSETPFQSAEGSIWKENRGHLETYAPGSQADFAIVPKGYTGGMIAVNEISCNRCHGAAGRPLADFSYPISLYGEVWGEDRIFTWHPFELTPYIYGPNDETGRPSRKPSQRMLRAGLILNEKPTASDPDYHRLPGQ